MTNRDLIDRILAAEGGLQNDPADLDGPLPTHFGITASTLAWWLGRPVTEADMKKLTEAEAREIYLKLYVTQPGFDKIAHDRLRYQLVDFGVHSGPSVAIRKLQEILGVPADGKLGPQTLKALDDGDPVEINNALVRARAEMVARLVQAKPSQLRFLVGWLRRILSHLL